MTWVRRTSAGPQASQVGDPCAPHPLLANGLVSSGRREAIVVGGMVALALGINFATSINGFGEQDAARILNDVLIWKKSGGD